MKRSGKAADALPSPWNVPSTTFLNPALPVAGSRAGAKNAAGVPPDLQANEYILALEHL